MKRKLLKTSAVLLAAFLANAAVADDKDVKSEKKAPATSAAASSKVAKDLSGKLVSAKDKKLSDYEIKGAPEFYVFYHSASW
jgi:hypothetical protein